MKAVLSKVVGGPETLVVEDIPAPEAKPGHAVPKERLFEQVFPGEDSVLPEAIEVVVYRLRKKLAPADVTLMTLRGLGYLLKAGK